jgi:tRNA-splicing ligase RtcB
MHNNRRSFEDQAIPFATGLNRILEKHPVLEKTICGTTKWIKQLGTLGGGNHFIEVCLDESNQVWVMLHSGSRGVGNALAEYFIQLARKDMERWMIQLPDRDLAYFPEGTEHFEDYVEAVHWAQEYALQNRQCMVDLVLAALIDPARICLNLVTMAKSGIQTRRQARTWLPSSIFTWPDQ